jgi:indolepyruvate ferredoxin oxidoreductase, beta subunit
MKSNIIIAGVGGQGSILTAKVLGQVLKNEGFDVKVSEIHGMSQRGGSVITFIRCADQVDSPLIEYGEADIILALEPLEGYRYISYLKKDGKMIINSQQIDPMSVVTGNNDYPLDIYGELGAMGVDFSVVDALNIAACAGNVKTVNTVILGCLAKLFTIPSDKWKASLKECVPETLADINIKAFESGYNIK